MPSSILKKNSGALASLVTSPTSNENRNYQTALYHANLLQQRKDVEAQILATTEVLLEIPTSTDADPSCPSPEDADMVVNLLRLFQPKDYDLLVQERNINTQCGYILCPRQNRKQETDAKYRIIRGKGRGSDAVKVVETASLQKWCSDNCGKRALYIKAQLNEEPAWIRGSTTQGDIVLLKDIHANLTPSKGDSPPLEGIRNLDISFGEEQLIVDMKALAIERGEASASSRSSTLIEVKENEPQVTPNHFHKVQQPDSYNTIEGYHPKLGTKKTQLEEESDPEDVMRTI